MQCLSHSTLPLPPHLFSFSVLLSPTALTLALEDTLFPFERFKLVVDRDCGLEII
jgi:hypothetical protein